MYTAPDVDVGLNCFGKECHNMWGGYGRYDNDEPVRNVSNTPLAKHCSVCGLIFSGTEDRFCRKCGSPRKEIARDSNQCACGAIVGQEDKHCYSCGKKVHS